MSVLTRAQDHIFIKLRTVNNIPGTKIPAVVHLEEDEDLIFDPSQWYVGVAEFRASLGSSTLVYKLADEEATPIKRIGGAVTQPSRAVLYTEIQEQMGRFASGYTKQQELRSLDVSTYSLAGLLEHLNPQTPDISAFFSMGEDGRIMLEKPHMVKATTCTEITLSRDLCDEFDLDDADIARFRASNRAVDQLIDILSWYTDLFTAHTPLMAFASHCITSTAPRSATSITGLSNAVQNSVQTLTVTLPDEYFDVNGIKQDAIIDSDMVPGSCALALHHFVNTGRVNAQGTPEVDCRVLAEARKWKIAYNTAHSEWRLESSECEWFFPSVGGEQVIIDDPILRIVAAMYQFFLTPSYTAIFDFQSNTYTNSATLDDEDWIDSQNKRLPALKNASVFKDQSATGRLQGRFLIRSANGNRLSEKEDNLRYKQTKHTLTGGRLTSVTAREFINLENMKRNLDVDGAPLHKVTADISTIQSDPTFRDVYQARNQQQRGEMNRAVKLQAMENRLGETRYKKQFLFEFNEPLTHSDAQEKFVHNPSVTQSVAYAQLLDFEAQHPFLASQTGDDVDQKTDEHVPHATKVPVGSMGTIDDFRAEDYAYDTRARLFERAYSVRRVTGIAVDAGMTFNNFFDGNNDAGYNALALNMNKVNNIRFAEVYHDPYHRARAGFQREVIVENQLRPQISHIVRYYEETDPRFSMEFGGKIQNSVYQFMTSTFHTTTANGVFQTTGGVQIPLSNPTGGLQPVTDALLREATAFNTEYAVAATEMSCFLDANGDETSYVELKINDAGVRTSLRLVDFENNHINIAIRQTGATRELKGRVLKFGKRYVVLDSNTQTHAYESTDCLMVELRKKDVPRLDEQNTAFPTSKENHVFSDSLGQTRTVQVLAPKLPVSFKIDWSDDSVQGQLENQGIQHLRIKPEIPFRICAGDKVKSLVPNSDSLQKYTSMGLVSTDGFLFKSTHFEGFKAPLLVEVPILNDIKVNASREFKTQSLSYSNTGDVYYTANGQYSLHQLMTNIPLRTGSIRLQLSTRDGTETKDCELAYRGVFEVKLILIRK